jgi:hypothetical protein
MAEANWRHLTAIAAGYIAGISSYSKLPGPYLTVDNQYRSPDR